ncbi:aminotransferase class I/II-fold pyridoxal phosphate-dependent enzyme [Variovorax sp. HJSM1_2]|uniref:aminotransferase class I/II-fold pyridoxal phosphate-dependent enzyme n=1 Tax=Variovorax sp. HJSM1_2 TaxID=3366263 RepID=UPI003BD638E0
MGLTPSAAAAVPTRLHGGVDAAGAAQFDFSTNSNAVGPCPEVVAALQQTDAARYPDPAYPALRERLAAWHGVAPARLVLAASASEFIFRFTAWMVQQGARRVWMPQHAYGDYAAAAQAWDLATVVQPAQAQLAWACDPSSPLGQDHLEWAGLPFVFPSQAAMPAGPVWVLDRAYAPLRLSGQPALTATQLDSVWQLLTPNKALGLTGVRAAYAIAPNSPEGLAAVSGLGRLCPSWPVGSHGVSLLQAWTTSSVQQWLAHSLDTLREWKLRQWALCEAMGWLCVPSHANFFVAQPQPMPGADESLGASATAMPERLAALRGFGVKLRDAASFGLPGRVRLAVLPPPAQDVLAQAWPRAAGVL